MISAPGPAPASSVAESRKNFAAARRALAAGMDIQSHTEPSEKTGRWQIQLEGDAGDLHKLLKDMPPDVVGEPALARYPASLSLRLGQPTAKALSAASGVGGTIAINVRALGKPLPDVHATLVLGDRNGRGAQSALSDVTDPDGALAFPYDPNLWFPVLLMLEPQSGFWGQWIYYPQATVTVDLAPLAKTGPLAWWHLAAGVGQVGDKRGAGVRIGIVDSGVGPHPYLAHVKSLGAVIGAQYEAGAPAGADALGHGTHVAGIIAARPVADSGDYAGIASGADVSVIRVFPPHGEANQGDIAEAIERLAVGGADLINLSLGGAQPSQIEQDAVRMAADLGALCIAAAGNNMGQPIIYPAAYPEVAAVSAIGVVGAYPAGTLEAQSLPAQPDQYTAEGFFLANFSNVGPEMTCTAPGVGIISTVPSRPEVAAPYAVQSGTSMAAPVACGALASLLARDTAYLGLPRGRERVQRASIVLAASLRAMAMSSYLVGGGLSQGSPS
jgi:subtilisin family serine protease